MAVNLLLRLAHLIHLVINAYIILIIIRAVISWMGNIPPNQFTHFIRRLTDPAFRLIYRILPYNFVVIGNIDISPIIITVALYLIDGLIIGLIRDIAFQVGGGI